MTRPREPSRRRAAPGETDAAARAAAVPGKRTASVDELLRAISRSGARTLPLAARAAGLSRRTFHRRLNEAGLKFSKLRDQSRFATAVRLLETRLKVSEIGSRLGYSDPAHFTRAFRRWTSVSPREYRRLRMSEPGRPAASPAREARAPATSRRPAGR